MPTRIFVRTGSCRRISMREPPRLARICPNPWTARPCRSQISKVSSRMKPRNSFSSLKIPNDRFLGRLMAPAMRCSAPSGAMATSSDQRGARTRTLEGRTTVVRGRGAGTRTRDLSVSNAARYQAALHPVGKGRLYETRALGDRIGLRVYDRFGLRVVVFHDLRADAFAQVGPPLGFRSWWPRVSLVGLSHDGNDDRPVTRLAELEAEARELLRPVEWLVPSSRWSH